MDTPASKKSSKDFQDDPIGTRSRRWYWTLNNYTPEEEAFLKTLDASVVDFLFFGHEVGEECGTPHLQGYVEFPKMCRRDAAKKALGTHRISIRKCSPQGTAEKNIIYCSKQDVDLYKFGTPIPDNGQSGKEAELSRWDEARRLAKEGQFDSIDSDIYMRCKRTCHEIRSIEVKKRKIESFRRKDWVCSEWEHSICETIISEPHVRDVHFLIAPPGFGKSQFFLHVVRYLPNVFCAPLMPSKELAYLINAEEVHPQAIIFDCPLATQCSDIDWMFVESLKNGFFATVKYDPAIVAMNTPTLYYFCNSEIWKRPDGEFMIAENRVRVLTLG